MVILHALLSRIVNRATQLRVKREALAYKSQRGTTSNRKGREEEALSVTSRSRTVTQGLLEPPTRRDIALRPWIELANAAGRRRPLENEPPRELITTAERQTQTPLFPRSAILALANDPE